MPDVVLNQRLMITDGGGIAIRLINKTGGASVKGTVVSSDPSNAESFIATPAEGAQPIGVVYEAGVADASPCWVVITGRCQVLLEDSTAATAGYWVRTGDTTAGRADATSAAPPGGGIVELDEHMQEIGHTLESQGAGTSVLAWIILHLN